MSVHPSVRRSRRNSGAVIAACDAVLETLERRRLLAVNLFYENFDGLAFGPPVEETSPGEAVWTNVPPAGWIKDDTGVPGYNNPNDNNGVAEWIGWTFPQRDWWPTVEDQTRSQFTNASGGIMAADPDEWDDQAHPGDDTYPADMLYNARITTKVIPLTNVRPGTLTVELDSSWRPEGFDDGDRVNNQTGIIEAVFSDGTSREILHWDSDPTNIDTFHPDSQNEHVTLQVGDIPAGATGMQLRFRLDKAANDWWWAVDNVAVNAILDIPGVRLIGNTGNRGDAGGSDPENDETLWNVLFGNGPTTDPAFLDGWEDVVPNPPNTVLSSVRGIGVTQGTGALRVEVPQSTTEPAFWGIRSPNVVDLLRTGATQLSYDMTLTGIELNGGSFGPAGDPDNSFNGFAQSNELAVVIAAPSGGFIQRNFIAGGATDSLSAASQGGQWHGLDGTRTITWDLTLFTAANGQSLADFITANNATEARFWLPTQGSDSNGNQGPMRFYFDNFFITTPTGDTVIGDFDQFSVSEILTLPDVPDTDAIGFNPESGLLHHTSGAESYSNTPTSPGYRDNQFMETIDVVSGSNAQRAIFNANSEQWGLPAPRPSWVEPTTRRTDEQTDGAFRVRGPNEYHAARDLTWSPTDHAFYVADEHGIFKLTADGQSTFVGNPSIPQGGVKGITFALVNGQTRLIVGQRDGQNLYILDPATAQIIGDPIPLGDRDSIPILGVLSLVTHPGTGEIFALAKSTETPQDPLTRNLIQIEIAPDLLSATGTTLGTFTGLQMADLAFVYPTASASVSEVYVRGTAWNAAFKAYMETTGVGDDVYGYRVDNKTGDAAVLTWVNTNEIVLRYGSAPTGGGIPTPGTVTVTGDRNGGNYTVTAVNQLDPQTFVLVLDRPLGNLSTGGQNGVRIDLVVPGGGSGGANFTQRINVLQGDVFHTGETNHVVVAADASDVKPRFFRSTAAPGPAGPTQYTIFHDVDGSGNIIANDFSLVKARFFNSIQTTPFPVAALQLASITADLFGSKRVLG